jgi:3-oxo-5alpha-steroid 4-dehydrogenase
MKDEDFIAATDVEPALTVSDADQSDWDDAADIVVVGFGGAGASAAIEAREQGADVLVIDRFGGGGATAYSGGIFYAAGTPIQKEAGYEDDARALEAYLAEEKAPVARDTLHRFAQGSAADFDWVARHVPFKATLYSGKASYPPEGMFLYYSGNEKIEQFAKVAKPAPRGHRAVGAGWTGNVFFQGLSQAVHDLATRTLLHAPVRRLLLDEAGRVVGLEILRIDDAAREEHAKLYAQVNPQMPTTGKTAEENIANLRTFEKTHGRIQRVRARKGVILSAGGFVYNLAMLTKYRPELGSAHREILRLGSPGCDGSGIALGISAGGSTDLMSNAFVGRTISPPETLLRGILVNRDGSRFANEAAYADVVGNLIARQPGGKAWLIMDRRTYWQSLWKAATIGRDMFLFWGLPIVLNLLLGGTRKARSLKRLAAKCGLDANQLQKSIDQYNADIAQQRKDAFGKLDDYRRALTKGPYCAVNMSIDNKYGFTTVFTLGGLRVDEGSGQVIREDGSPIAGLYAAGRTAVGLCSAGYVSGMSLADLVFSGRRAAQACVAAS